MNLSSFTDNPVTKVESHTNTKAFDISYKCFKNRIACSFRSGHKFTIYPRSHNVNKTGDNSEDDVLLQIRQSVLLFHSILRKLVNESNGTFLSLQKSAAAARESDNHVEFLKLSRQYRSIIRVCIESLQEAATKATDSVKKDNLMSYITIFYSVECIWHLCEILFIDTIPGDVVLPYLLEWVRFHFPSHEQTAAQLLESCERDSEEHREYWDTVIGMVVQGRVDVARALLKLHSAADSHEFKLVDNSLRSMPVYSVYGGISVGEFTISWKHWQAECRSKLSSRVLASQPKLDLIMRLMIGDYAAFESLSSNYLSWFDMVGGWVLFTAPWARKHELRAAASACSAMKGGAGSHLDLIVRALFDGDLHQVIHEIQQISDIGWFAAHLTDILHHCGKLKILDKHQIDVTEQLRNSLVMEYGCLMMEHRSLWQVGLSYLGSAGREGTARAALLLERVPGVGSSDFKALRVIAAARALGLEDVAEAVCLARGARALAGGRGGAALAWAARARGTALGGGAARDLAKADKASQLALVALVAHEAPTHDHLLALCKHCEFKRLYQEREFKKAAELLVSLITSNIAPDYLWQTLLLDAIPLLESDEPVVSATATLDLMTCSELRPCDDDEKSQLLRLALVRNLARALVVQGDEL